MAAKEDKNTFVFHGEWREAFCDYTKEEQADIYNAIIDYALGGIVPEDRFIRAAIANARITIDRDKQRYEEKCERNRQNVTYRWRQTKRPNTTEYAPTNDNDSDNGNDIKPNTNVSGEEKKKTSKEVKKKPASEKRFVKPTPDEVQAYCDERGNGIDGERFCDFYESKGWKIGKETMKDWRAAVRTWEQRDPAHKPTKAGKQQPKCKLGVGEFIAQDGTRRYGTGNLPPVPMDAPPRPDNDSLWSRETNTWIPSGV